MHVVMMENEGVNRNHAISNTFRHLIMCLLLLREKEDISLSVISGANENAPLGLPQGDVNLFEIDTALYSIPGNLKYSLAAYSKLKQIHRTASIDIIHARYPLSSLVAAAWFKKKVCPKTKLVYDLGSPWIDMMGEKFKPLSNPFLKGAGYGVEALLCRWVDGFSFYNEDIASHYARRIPRSATRPSICLGFEYNSLAFETRLFSRTIAAELRLGEGDIVVGTMSMLQRMREIDFIIEGFVKFKQERHAPGVKLVIIGDGPERDSLERLVQRMDVAEEVRFVGLVDHQVIPEYLSVFNVGISHLPDRFAFRVSSPIKLLEYLACGVPVLASNVRPHQRLNDHSSNVFLYENNLESFCQALDLLLRDLPQKGEVLKERRLLEERFGSTAIAQKHLGLYQRLLS